MCDSTNSWANCFSSNFVLWPKIVFSSSLEIDEKFQILNLKKTPKLELKKNWNLEIKKPQVSNSQENQVLELEKKDWEKEIKSWIDKKMFMPWNYKNLLKSAWKKLICLDSNEIEYISPAHLMLIWEILR